MRFALSTSSEIHNVTVACIVRYGADLPKNTQLLIHAKVFFFLYYALEMVLRFMFLCNSFLVLSIQGN